MKQKRGEEEEREGEDTQKTGKSDANWGERGIMSYLS